MVAVSRRALRSRYDARGSSTAHARRALRSRYDAPHASSARTLGRLRAPAGAGGDPTTEITAAVQSTEAVLYFDATRVETGTMFLIRDASPEGNNCVAGGHQRPALVPSWLDGNAGIAFDETSESVLRFPGFRGLGKGDKPFLIAIASVGPVTTAPVPTIFLLIGDQPLQAGPNEPNHVFNLSVSDAPSQALARARLGGTKTLSSASGGASYADGVPRLFYVHAANASDRAEIYVDGVLRGTAPAGDAGGLSQTPVHGVLGGGDADTNPNQARWLTAVLGMVLLFRQKPLAAELAKLEDTVIASRWPTMYAGLP